MKTRYSDKEREEQFSFGELSQKCSDSLDKGADTYRSIQTLDEYSKVIEGPISEEIDQALDDMGTVLVHLASVSSGGDMDGTRKELESRGLDSII